MEEVFDLISGLTALRSQGRRDFYHHVVVERPSGKESLLVKCGWMGAPVRSRRDELSDDFVEEESVACLFLCFFFFFIFLSRLRRLIA